MIEVYDTGSVLKLFRRSLLERTGLQFEEGLASDEDGPFAARAYFEASGISVCADYNFYFLRSRPGSQTRRLDRIEDLAEGIVRIDSQRMALVAAYRKPGVGRDALMIKHIADVLRPFRDGRWLRLDVAERSRVFEVASSVIRRWHTRWIDLALPPWLAVRAYCLRLGLLAELVDIAGCPPGIGYAAPIVDGRRIYARWPHFRDAAGIPDRYFDITSRVAPQIRVTRLSVDAAELHISGEAFLALLGGSTALLLRRWPRGRRLRFETAAAPTPNLRDRQTRYPQAGFDGTIHLPTAEAGGPISPGIWRILLSIQAGGITRTAAVTTSEVIERANSVPVEAGARAIGPWCIQTTPTGEFRLRVYPVPRVAASLELAAGYGVRLVQALARPVLVSRPGRLALAALNEIRPAYAATLRRSIRGGPSATNR